MKTVNVMERNNERALLYGKMEDIWKLGQSNKEMKVAETSRQYVVRDRITSTIHEMAQSVNVVCTGARQQLLLKQWWRYA